MRGIEPVAPKGKAIFVAIITEPASLSVLASPGEYGADIAVGELMSFGNTMSYGGAGLGFMAARGKNMGFLPRPGLVQNVEEGGRKQNRGVFSFSSVG